MHTPEERKSSRELFLFTRGRTTAAGENVRRNRRAPYFVLYILGPVLVAALLALASRRARGAKPGDGPV